MIGLPWLGASVIRMFRGMIVVHDLTAQVPLHLGLDLGGQAGPPIEHGQDYPFDLQPRD